MVECSFIASLQQLESHPTECRIWGSNMGPLTLRQVVYPLWIHHQSAKAYKMSFSQFVIVISKAQFSSTGKCNRIFDWMDSPSFAMYKG